MKSTLMIFLLVFKINFIALFYFDKFAVIYPIFCHHHRCPDVVLGSGVWSADRY